MLAMKSLMQISLIAVQELLKGHFKFFEEEFYTAFPKIKVISLNKQP